MTLTDEQKHKIKTSYARECTNCGQTKFDVKGKAIELAGINLAMVVCKVCYHTRLFSMDWVE